MKKLLDGKFLLITITSLVFLIAIILGAFYLFNDSEDSFIKSGYVLNPLSENREKYLFEENTEYRTNLSMMVEFIDIDKQEVSVLKDSFIHYTDGSLSFLKNGAIVDLDSISSSNAVVFYNISNQIMFDKEGSNYIIKNSANDISLNNFMGRISDNKYILVGNIQAKIPGNETLISGDYFEIVYTEEGIVNIENNDVKFQVTADDTEFYLGNITVSLGDKSISLNGNKIMSITEITIDGNENIELLPSTEDPGEDGDEEEGTGNTPNQEQNGTTLPDDEQQGTTSPGGEVEITEDIIISLMDASVGSTSVMVLFDIINDTPSDDFTLRVVNLDTGRTIDVVNHITKDTEIRINLLSPQTKYLFTVVNETDGGKYFQKIFETKDFGITLERTYATDSEIQYKVSIDEDTDITNAKLSLYKFNEETHQNEIVTTSYYDSETGETNYTEKVVWLNNIKDESFIVFDGLDSNTIYTAVLDEFSLTSANFKDIYNITLTSMTLKKTPKFSDMTAEKDMASGSFKLSLGNITDEDNAIVGYTYLIYEQNNPNETVIDPITKTNASPIEVKIGDGENQLKNDTNYFYRVIIEYFDNEKYVEYTTSDTINFNMGSEPYVTVVPNQDLISYDQIGATIYLTDNSCLVSVPNRPNCSTANSTTVITVKKNTVAGEVIVYSRIVDFEVIEDEIKYSLTVDGLQEGTQYSIEVSAILNNDEELKRTEIMHTDESIRTIQTKTLSSFMAIYPAEDRLLSSANHVVNQRVKLEESANNTGSMSASETASAIKKVVISLYEGSHIEDISTVDPIVSPMVFTNNDTTNLKEMFYDNYYEITTDKTFGIDIDTLRSLSTDGRLSPEYTLMIKAYYDLEETNEVKIENNIMVYTILESLLLDNVEEPIIITKPITNEVSGYLFDKLNDRQTIVGYSVNAVYDRLGLINNNLYPENINIYVYNANRQRVKFYIKNNNNLVLVDKITTSISNLEIGNYLTEIYMDYGSEYQENDTIMKRGNNYYIGYEIEVSTSSGNVLYPSNSNASSPSDYGVYELVTHTLKETPNVKMYIASSTATSITYRYEITDPDKALYREDTNADYGFYYVIGDNQEQKLSLNTTDNYTYSGNLTITGLSNGDIYNLYYKKNLKKSGIFEEDVVNYLDGSDDGYRLFDGYYDAKDETYNFKYELINNPLTDNKVTIKILSQSELLSRIISYRVKFTDSLGNTLNKEIWELTSCSDTDELRCFSVDYIDLKNAGMKSDKDAINNISVSIDAIYDNGLTGYDFSVGEDGDYPYMIMQNNNTSTTYGSYLSYNSSGSLVTWLDTLGVSKGYYTYSFNNDRRTSLFYKSAYNANHRSNINNISLSSIGYLSSYGTLNPKMISIDTMSTDNNIFYFSSITPKISVSEYSQLINGSVMGITLSGADLADIQNEGTSENPEYYIYIDVWSDQTSALNEDLSKTVRPRLKVKISNENPNSRVLAVIDSLKSLSSDYSYYFNVYAYMYKNGNYEFTQLFDENIRDDYETKTYSFKTKNGESLYTSREISYQIDESIYGNRILNTKINLTSYQNAYPYNFDLIYLICQDNECTTTEGYIFKKEIPKEEVSSQIISTEDITSYDLEYNKNYYIKIFAVAPVYELNETGEFVLNEQLVNLISSRDRLFKLTALRDPSFVVTRKAGYDNGEYYIDFTINVSDLDRTLQDGKYYIKLTDASQNVVGVLQELTTDGTYLSIADYENHQFDATELNKKIRITGLDPDTRYSIMVYGTAYVNNYDENIPKPNRTYEVKTTHTIYTTDNYGVTFGHDISYVITDNSFIALFRSGTNFDNVVSVNYSISLDDEFNPGVIVTGSDIIGDDHKFEFNDESGYGMYVITRNDGITNTLGKYYLITLSFEVKDPNNADETIILTSAYNPRFTDSVAYVKDMENNQ